MIEIELSIIIAVAAFALSAYSTYRSVIDDKIKLRIRFGPIVEDDLVVHVANLSKFTVFIWDFGFTFSDGSDKLGFKSNFQWEKKLESREGNALYITAAGARIRKVSKTMDNLDSFYVTTECGATRCKRIPKSHKTAWRRSAARPTAGDQTASTT